MRPRFAAVVLGAVAVLGACGGDSGSDDGRQLSAEAQRGRELAEDNGCMSCHRRGGGIGPDWEGLYGSTVELVDGSTVVADDRYLVRAITDPGADVVAGYNVSMPTNNLEDEQVESIVAYIRELSASETTRR